MSKDLVLDASVVLKWFFVDPQREPDLDKALLLLRMFSEGEIRIIQPVHWLAEVAAVLSRLSPLTAGDDITDLDLMGFDVTDHPDAYTTASRLAIDIRHHLFDTLYHAVALEEDALLVTADEHYYRKAKKFGSIVRLADL